MKKDKLICKTKKHIIEISNMKIVNDKDEALFKIDPSNCMKIENLNIINKHKNKGDI